MRSGSAPSRRPEHFRRRDATVAAIVPLTLENMENVFLIDGAPPLPDDVPRPRTYLNMVDENYFDTAGIRIVRGRPLRDRSGGHRQGCRGQRDIGHAHVARTGSDRKAGIVGGEGPEEWRVVVGVAANIRYNTLGEDPPIFTYLPVAQSYHDSLVVQVRARDAAAIPACPPRVDGHDSWPQSDAAAADHPTGC